MSREFRGMLVFGSLITIIASVTSFTQIGIEYTIHGSSTFDGVNYLITILVTWKLIDLIVKLVNRIDIHKEEDDK